jgi:RNA polymerase sigma-70 factor (ECF subfamily)
LFDALRGHIAGASSPSYRKIAEELGMKEGAIKVAAHRLRERYGQQLRLQVARTLDAPDQVNEELHYLFEALASEG